MDDGIYRVTVRASGGEVVGVVTVAAGRFNGGGEGYVFRGQFTHVAAGVVEILKVDRDVSPRLGLFRSIKAPVAVAGEPKAFRLEGRVNGHHVIEVSLEGKWIAESI
jgi:hypothetical protein